MMTFLPMPYKDEILYSTLARYHLRSGNSSYKATMIDLYGDYDVTAVVDLPANIGRLIENMPMGNKYTSEYIIFNHTLYSLYSCFLPLERAEKVFDSMVKSKGGDIYTRTGIMASSITMNRYFMFCPECMKEDLEKNGEYYWHRIHQVPCITLCTKHKCFLCDSEVEVRGFNKYEYKIPTINNCISKNIKSGISDNDIEKLITLGGDIEVLLNNQNGFENKPIEWFKLQYINHLKRKGLANINGNIYMKEFLKCFVEYYGDNFLILVQSSVDKNNDINWLSDMVRNKNNANHVIRHLLLIQFLGISLMDLFNIKYEFKPFGDGPWLCLNKAAEHYHQAVVEDLKTNYDAEYKIPIGTFKCKCGFIYTRRGTADGEDDSYKFSRIKEFGHVWEEKLKELVNINLSLRETARRLGVDATTVRKYALKLGLKGSWYKEDINNDVRENEKDAQETSNSKMVNYKTKWLQLLKQYPDKGKNELREVNKAVYIWLFRNDNDWLNENSPTRKATVNINKRVDWEARDRDILVKVKKLVEAMLSSDDKPQRISIGFIGKKLGINSLLEQHLDKMPQTDGYIETVKENNRDYHIRKIKWAIRVLDEEGQEVLPWKVFRKAGIRDEYQKELEEEMFNLIAVESNDRTLMI